MSEACMMALERWKELAEVENMRAREIWGSTGGWYQRPENFEDPDIIAARKRRDAQIAAWHAAGICTREISQRTGLVEASVNRVLRLRRLAAREE